MKNKNSNRKNNSNSADKKNSGSAEVMRYGLFSLDDQQPHWDSENGEIYHATVLNLHQPAGNLDNLLRTQEWEAKAILYAYDRIARSLWGHEQIARVHLAMSGTLLETLSNPEFQQKVYGIVKCGELLWQMRHPSIDILGTGYYHPVLPLIPAEDRGEQISRWQGLARHLFDRQNYGGFWPPEMGFSMELIPLLKKAGYRYVIVDSDHIEPVGVMRWEEIRYRPHIAKFEGEEIVVIVRDRDLSNAQESGMDLGWFNKEVRERTRCCDFPPLVVTCSDGENGGWFRNTNSSANYWGVFYQPLIEAVRQNATRIRPTFIHEYLDKYPAKGEVRVRPGAWNTGWHHGVGFIQWTGSIAQREALSRVFEISRMYHAFCRDAEMRKKLSPEVQKCLSEAYWHLLRAETSCNYFWGMEWVERAHADLNETIRWLDSALSIQDKL